MHWTLIAGIGRVESTHAYDGKDADDNGNLLKPVLGLSSTAASAARPSSATPTAARSTATPSTTAPSAHAVPPETWNQYAGDGNGDGIADPQNLFDSALTTGKYLCDGGLNMQGSDSGRQGDPPLQQLRRLRGQRAGLVAGYSTGIMPAASDLPRIH